MANVKVFDFRAPEYLASDFEALCKSYGVLPSSALRYFLWNARNIFDRYSEGNISKIRELILHANADIVVHGAMVMEGSNKKKNGNILGKDLGIFKEDIFKE